MKKLLLVLMMIYFALINQSISQPRIYENCMIDCLDGPYGYGPGTEICSSDNETGLIFLGYVNYGTDIVKFDSVGSLVFIKTLIYPIQYSNPVYYSEVISIKGNGYLVSGIFDYTSVENNIITRLTSDASVVWSKTLNNFDINLDNSGLKMVCNPYTSGFLIYGTDTGIPKIIEMDSIGNIISSYKFSGIDSILSCIITKDSSYLFSALSGNNFIVFKMDSTGVILNSAKFGLPTIINQFSLISYADKYVVEVSNNDSGSIYMFNLDSNLQNIWAVKLIEPAYKFYKLLDWNDKYFNLVTRKNSDTICTINIDSSGIIIGSHVSGYPDQTLIDCNKNAQGIIILYNIYRTFQLMHGNYITIGDAEVSQLDSLGHNCSHDTIIVSPFVPLLLNGNSVLINPVISNTQTSNQQIVSQANSIQFVTECSVFIGIPEINQNKENEIKVYPNPTTGTFTLSIRNLSPALAGSNWDLRIIDVLGQEVYSQPIINQESTIINLPQISNGVYFYQLSNSKETFRGKFVKQ